MNCKENVTTGSYYWKREPGWTNLRGMWGKRSAPFAFDAYASPDALENGNRPHVEWTIARGALVDMMTSWRQSVLRFLKSQALTQARALKYH